MKTLVVIQARLGGQRFPQKIRKDLAGISVLEHVVRRARNKGFAVLVAMPIGDAPRMDWSGVWRQAVRDNRGRPALVPLFYANAVENDVLGRITQAVEWANDASRFLGLEEFFGCVVRVTADCPFVPVAAIDAVAEAVVSGRNDYCETRSDPSTRPNGIDAQACRVELLQEAAETCIDPEGREHVTGALLGVSSTPGRVSELEGLRLDDLPSFRITLDTPKDLERYRAMAEFLTVDPGSGRPTLTELRDLQRQRPDLFYEEGA